MKNSGLLLVSLLVSSISVSAMAEMAPPPLPPAPPPAPSLQLPAPPAAPTALPPTQRPMPVPPAPPRMAPVAAPAPAVVAPPAPPIAPAQAPAPVATTAPEQLAPLPASAELPVIVTERAGVSPQKGLKSMGRLISTQIKSCWVLPKADRNVPSLEAIINIGQDGSLSLAGFTTDATERQQPLVNSIQAALSQCSPLKNLPPQEAYDDWKAVIITFNPRK